MNEIFRDEICIAYGGNKRVFPLILLSALSIAKHTDKPLHFYICTMDLSEQNPSYIPITQNQKDILENAIKAKNANSKVTLLDAKPCFLTTLHGGKNKKNSYTPYATLRLLLDKLTDKRKMIYLDMDVMCCSDISQLWDINIEGHEYAAVKDHMGKFWINKNYCNSGVMLLNLQLIREQGFFDRVLEYVRTKRLMFPDQTSLNRLANNKLIIERKFNEQRAIKQDTVLKHFCQGIRWFPFFKVYNYKQTDRKNVHKKLKIFDFDDIYELFDEISLTSDINS